jgi:PQQ-dependent dehydrogenase (methanol/ethanol family)
MKHLRLGLLAPLVLLVSCNQLGSGSATKVDGDIIAAGTDSDWLSYGRTYDEQRFSPLKAINVDNAKDLGLAWSADFDTARGQEATPLVIDGKLYTTTAWSKVRAYDGATGKLLWEYDPKVPGPVAVKACCDVVNRGLAAWGDKLFLGALDGRLIALDRTTGKQLWSTVTVDQSKDYTITGAPRVVDGLVIIGNGGAEYGVRGYVTAYDAQTGKQAWRFYTVPDQPGKNGPDYLKKAEATWTGDYWKLGGGGTVWDSMAYDAKLDLLYIGVGNGAPWNQSYRSPGGGDNLYLSSIVAIRPKTGAYVWHYQTTPGETWDYTATQHIMLADLKVGGETRRVVMQAPKNGFFYVLDAATGKLISADGYVPQSWTKGVDMKTGRPVEIPEARYDKTGKLFVETPGPGGGHNWHPMAFSPVEGLVYIPVNLTSFPYLAFPNWKATSMGFNTGTDFATPAMPADKAVRGAAIAGTTGALVAWDPVARKERWRVPLTQPNNGGVLATAGGLVFQGNTTGAFVAYSAHDGKPLWSFDGQSGIVAPPVTYKIGGDQFVAVLTGPGGAYALSPGIATNPQGKVHNISRLLVFKLGGKAALPAASPVDPGPLNPPANIAGADIATGSARYGRYCGLCHGDAAISSGILPDLRRSSALGDAATWQKIVHDGALKDAGMVAWSPVMTAQEIEAIRAYVIKRANEDKALGGPR